MAASHVLLIVSGDPMLRSSFERLREDIVDAHLCFWNGEQAGGSDTLPSGVRCVVIDFGAPMPAALDALQRLRSMAPAATVVALVDILGAGTESALRQLGVHRLLDRETSLDMAANLVNSWLEEAL